MTVGMVYESALPAPQVLYTNVRSCGKLHTLLKGLRADLQREQGAAYLVRGPRFLCCFMCCFPCLRLAPLGACGSWSSAAPAPPLRRCVPSQATTTRRATMRGLRSCKAACAPRWACRRTTGGAAGERGGVRLAAHRRLALATAKQARACLRALHEHVREIFR